MPGDELTHPGCTGHEALEFGRVVVTSFCVECCGLDHPKVRQSVVIVGMETSGLFFSLSGSSKQPDSKLIWALAKGRFRR